MSAWWYWFPGMGDDLQAFKAGIMEIADIFVINKSDQPLVEKVQRELESALSLATRRRWLDPGHCEDDCDTKAKASAILVQQVDLFNHFVEILLIGVPGEGKLSKTIFVNCSKNAC